MLGSPGRSLRPARRPTSPASRRSSADEEDARDIRAKTTRSAADKQKLLELAKHVAHETQHARFGPAAQTIVPAAADCKLDTVVAGSTRDVARLLSEMSAQIAEFDVFFKNTQSSPGDSSAPSRCRPQSKIS